jgi:hypothetical protein
MNKSSDQLAQEKSVDQRSVKRIASFEPRERTMDTQNNHQSTVCMKICKDIFF